MIYLYFYGAKHTELFMYKNLHTCYYIKYIYTYIHIGFAYQKQYAAVTFVSS